MTDDTELQSIIDSVSELEDKHAELAAKYAGLKTRLLLYTEEKDAGLPAASATLTKQQFVDYIMTRVLQHGFDYSVKTNYTRDRDAIKFRQICFFLIKHKSKLALWEIGRYVAPDRVPNFDHATVLHGCRKLQNDLDLFKKFGNDSNETHKVLTHLMKTILSFSELAYKLKHEFHERNDILEEAVEVDNVSSEETH